MMCGELGYLKTSGIARIKAKLKLNAYYPVYMHAHAQHILPTTLTPGPITSCSNLHFNPQLFCS